MLIQIIAGCKRDPHNLFGDGVVIDFDVPASQVVELHGGSKKIGRQKVLSLFQDEVRPLLEVQEVEIFVHTGEV